MDDDLVPLAGPAGIQLVMHRGFGDHAERVSLLLAQRRRVPLRIVDC
ncbi:MAG TPA: hypothetical protein VMQ51_05145 [Candidatus Binatia bacterium]|nr:hypothetical protein [Candidatus Binatia bacterium]